MLDRWRDLRCHLRPFRPHHTVPARGDGAKEPGICRKVITLRAERGDGLDERAKHPWAVALPWSTILPMKEDPDTLASKI
jgi:hypothetical protein